MGTMGPVSEETGLSLWDAMSVFYHLSNTREGGEVGGKGKKEGKY